MSQELATPVLQRALHELKPISLVARFGLPTLLGVVALVLGWCFFTFIAVNASSQGKLTFWYIVSITESLQDLFQAMQSGSTDGSGFSYYSFAAIVAMLLPLLPSQWDHKFAYIANFAPLAFLLFIFGTILMGAADFYQQAQAFADGGIPVFKFVKLFVSALGLGFYLSTAACLFFAGKGAIKYLASRAR